MQLPPWMRAAVLDAIAVLLPVSCVGCGAPDRAVCDDCALQLQPSVRRWKVHPGLSVWSGLPNSGVMAAGIRALKDEGRTELLGPLAPALRAAVIAALAESADLPPSSVLLVPIPSGAAAYQRRGFRPVEALMRRARLRGARILVPGAVRAADQRRLGRAERAHNVAGSLRLRRRIDGAIVLLVDDVLTSGATIREAATVLETAGARVVGAAVLARTPRLLDGEQTSR